MSEARRYLAYLLRLWRVDDDGQPLWRATLEDPHTGERRGFADLSQLFAFLEERLGTRPPGSGCSEEKSMSERRRA